MRDNLIPPAGLIRRVAFLSLVFGIGAGVFTTGSAVFFTHVVGLKAYEIGIGLSVAAVISFIGSVPLSTLADRFGPQRTWTVGIAVEGALFALWPFARGFWAFLVVIAMLQLANTVAQAGRSVYLIEAFPPENRVIAQAFNRSWLNVGWSIGAVAAGLALALDTRAAYYALVLINAAILVGTSLMVARLPQTRHAAQGVKHRSWAVFRDRPFLGVTALCAVLFSHATVLSEVMPLWLITHTDAPKWTLAVLTIINTIMAVTLQVVVTKGAHTIPGAGRVLRWGGLSAAACAPVFWLAGSTSGWVTIGVLVLGVILITMSELWQSAGAWTVSAELSPSDRRGEYQGAFRMGASMQNMVGPASLIALAITTGGWGWLVVSAIFLVATLAVRPVLSHSADARLLQTVS